MASTTNSTPEAVEVMAEEPFNFEGPEKRLEVLFEPMASAPGHPGSSTTTSSSSSSSSFMGLRALGKEGWKEVLDLVHCTILSETRNSHLVSYVLSESSLFVYDDKIVLKTCGTTTLLKCIKKLEEVAATKCNLSLKGVIFSRKNYNFPTKQIAPHTDFESEVGILYDRFKGSAHVLGPILTGGDHHYVFVSEHPYTSAELANEDSEELDSEDSSDDPDTEPAVPVIRAAPKLGTTLEGLMSELSPVAMEHFFRNEKYVSAKQTTKDIGLDEILPGLVTDEHMFDPCGYSVNGINDSEGYYMTVHVTPEPHCSFVSFETNADLCPVTRAQLISKVIQFFRPGRFSVIITSPVPVSSIKTHIDGFACKFHTQYQYEASFHVNMMNYRSRPVRAPASEVPKKKKTTAVA